MEVSFEPVAVAQSAHRLAGRMLSLNDFSWDGMSADDQSRYLRLAVAGPRRLAAMEGSSLREAGEAMRSIFYGEDAPPASLLDGPFWEAIARHLWVLIDCDELLSLEASEEQWAEWFKGKVGVALV
jgi:hypothetical protein